MTFVKTFNLSGLSFLPNEKWGGKKAISKVLLEIKKKSNLLSLFTYNKLNPFKAYSSMNFDKCMHLCNHTQINMGHFHYLQNVP